MKQALSLAAIFVLTATLLFVAILASDKPPVRYYGQPEAEGNKETAEPKERGTKDAPLFVEVVRPKKSEYEAANDETERQEKTALERSMVKWTAAAAFAASVAAIIAFVQAGFFYRQLDIMAKGVKDAELAAKAALGTLELARTGERAYIKLSQHSPGLIFGDQPMRGGGYKILVHIAAKNWGKTPGTVADIALKLETDFGGKRETLPWLAPMPNTADTPLAFLVPDEEFTTTFAWEIGVAELKRIKDEAFGSLYLSGHVDYIDSFKGRWRSGYERWYRREFDDPAIPADKRINLRFVTNSVSHYDIERAEGQGPDWTWEKWA